MIEIKFNDILNGYFFKLLSSGKTQYFDGNELNIDSGKFAKYLENNIKRRPNYKQNSWFEYDEEEFSIYLSDNLGSKISLFKENNIVDYITSLDFFEFELSCIVCMKKFFNSQIEADIIKSADDGIDFYGRYTSIDSSESNFFDINTWYIGQAKFYKKNRIQTSLLRELIGSVELAKNKIWSLENSYKNIDIKHNENVVPIIISSSRFSSYSLEIAYKFGIKLIDIIDLIFWLTIKFDGQLEKIKNEIKYLKRL